MADDFLNYCFHCYFLHKTFLGSQLVGFYAQNAEVVAINAPHKAVKAMLGYAGNVLLDHLFRVSCGILCIPTCKIRNSILAIINSV